MKVSLAKGVVVEEVGSDVVVMVPESIEALRLSGDAADVVRAIQLGSTVSPGALVSDLFRLGVVDSAGVSRRGLLRAGAIGAGAGIVVLSMPGVATASSGNGAPDGDAAPDGDVPPTESVDFEGVWGRIYDPGADGEPDTIIGVNFGVDSETKFSPLPSLGIDGANVDLNGEEIDWLAIDAQYEIVSGRTGYSYLFESAYPGSIGNRGTTLEPDDAIFRTLVQQLIDGTAVGPIFGTLTIGEDSYRVRFDFQEG
jgi:hypothetical protein